MVTDFYTPTLRNRGFVRSNDFTLMMHGKLALLVITIGHFELALKYICNLCLVCRNEFPVVELLCDGSQLVNGLVFRVVINLFNVY